MATETTSYKRSVLISVLTFIFLLFFNSVVYGQWVSVPPPSVSTSWWLEGAYFTSPSEGWAVGWDDSNHIGVLLHYSGGSWTSVPLPSVSTGWWLGGVCFTSPTEGWAVGGDYTNNAGVLLHYSGGSWTSVPPPSVSTDWALWGVHFTSPSEGWAVGWGIVGEDYSSQVGVLLHYSGGSWTSVPPPSVSTDVSTLWSLVGVHFTSPSEGWAVGGDDHIGVLLHYSGGTWTSVPPPSVSTDWDLLGVQFTSPSEGWAVGEDYTNPNTVGVLLHYSEGTWTSVPLPSVGTNWALQGVHFTSPSEGWAVGWDNSNHIAVLLHYSGGMWTSVPPPSVSTNWWLGGVYFSSPTEGWAVGGDDSNSTGVLLRFMSPMSPIFPTEGTIGTEITITGSGFGTTKGKVLVGTVPPKILEWTASSIRCQLLKVPPLGIYDVTIQPKKVSPINVDDGFTVMPPQINSVEPNHGSVGANVTIHGFFFGTKKGKVTLGGKSCKVTSWTMAATTGVSKIIFIVPKGLTAGTKELKVTNSVGADTTNFTVDSDDHTFRQTLSAYTPSLPHGAEAVSGEMGKSVPK